MQKKDQELLAELYDDMYTGDDKFSEGLKYRFYDFIEGYFNTRNYSQIKNMDELLQDMKSYWDSMHGGETYKASSGGTTTVIKPNPRDVKNPFNPLFFDRSGNKPKPPRKSWDNPDDPNYFKRN